MKKVLYTILSILSIVYIAFLSVAVVRDNTPWAEQWVNLPEWFTKIFDLVVNFGGVAIIFCFALVNFAGSPLKTVFFILLILAIVCYIVVMAVPDFFYNLFAPAESAAEFFRMF